MLWILLALCIGILAGFAVPFDLPSSVTPFVAVGLLAALYSMFGAIVAYLREQFEAKLFINGFLFNTILAMGLTFVGVKLGVDFSIAVIVYFGTKIFKNFSRMQYYILQKEAKGVKLIRRCSVTYKVNKNKTEP